MYPLLDQIKSVKDVKRLSVKQLPQLASELRSFLIKSVQVTGGHLASNLGVVELTIALVYVYDFPFDRVLWDVGHQSYVYKILTGRKDQFDTLRQINGLCGFPDRNESPYDCFNTGHASTSISAALGMARVRDLNCGTRSVLAVIGDGAMTGGMAWEAINDLASQKTPMTIVLNDNNMSISRNIGGLSRHLSRIRVSKGYARFKAGVLRVAKGCRVIYRMLKKFRDGLKLRVVHGKLFEQMGLKYIGPIDGHNVMDLVTYFESIKDYRGGPLLVHVVTKKGKGMAEAEALPEVYHGITGNAASGSSCVFGAHMGACLTAFADRDRRIVAITAAMASGTGLDCFAKQHPDRFFDVAIAEQHAVTLAAGMASAGAKPYVAIYSTFLQRAFDQVLHDVCLQDLPVTFCVDRAGVSDGDGSTHCGLFDLDYLCGLPNMTVLSPKNCDELSSMLDYSLTYQHPLVIRYPKHASTKVCLYKNSGDVCSWQEVKQGKRHDVTIVVCSADVLDAVYDLDCRIVYVPCLTGIDQSFLEGFKGTMVFVGDRSSNSYFSRITSYYVTHKCNFEIKSIIFDGSEYKSGTKKQIYDRIEIAGKLEQLLSIK